MAQELFYTSTPRGLLPGSQGFCTVAATRGMQPGLIEKLESLTGYKPLFPPNDANAEQNPVGYFHYRMTISGRTAHILGRIGSAPTDYSGRTNKFAHIIVLDSSELPDCGPAALLLDPSFLQSSWEGSPEWIDDPKRVPSFDQPASYCRQWHQMTGDAGWAGVLVNAFETTPHQSIYLMYEPGQDQQVLTLFAEALALLPPEERWNVGFSTYPTNLSPGITCHWRGAVSGFADAKSLQRTGSLVWPLTPQLGRAEDGPLTRAAREGKAPQRERARTPAPIPAPVARPQANFPPPPPVSAPNRLSGMISTPPPPMNEDEDVQMIEEELAPRPRSRPAPRRDTDYPRESPRSPSTGGSRMLLGMLIGLFVALIGIVGLESVAQNGLVQMFAGKKAEPEKPSIEDITNSINNKWEKSFHDLKGELKSETKKVLERDDKIKELTDPEKLKQNRLEIELELRDKVKKEFEALNKKEVVELKKPKVPQETVANPPDKGQPKVVPPVQPKDGQPLKANTAFLGRDPLFGDLVPSQFVAAQNRSQALSFTGKSIEILFPGELLKVPQGRMIVSEEGKLPLTLSFEPNEGKEIPILDLSREKDYLVFNYRAANLGENTPAVIELLKRTIIKVADSKSDFFQCIYLREPTTIQGLGKFSSKVQPGRESKGWQPRTDFDSAAIFQIAQISTPEVVKHLRVTNCEVEVEGYPPPFRGPTLPFPLIELGEKNRPNFGKEFKDDSVLWHTVAKEKRNSKDFELSFSLSVYGKAMDAALSEMEVKAMLPPLKPDQVKIRNFVIGIDLDGAQIPLFQYRDDKPFEKKKDPKKDELKKDPNFPSINTRTEGMKPLPTDPNLNQPLPKVATPVGGVETIPVKEAKKE